MRALVTGANGFIGRGLVRRLRALGWDTTAVARRPSDDRVEVVDDYSTSSFSALLRNLQPDVVFHAAGRAGRAPAEEMIRSNVLLTAQLFAALDAVRMRPTVVLIGSAAEYGPVTANNLPLCESQPCQPISDYGASKYAQTLFGLNRARDGWPVVIARLFNPIGPEMPTHLALGDFAARLRRRERVMHVGNLDVRRDFIEIDEAARIIVGLSNSSGARGRIVNVCAGEAFHLGSILNRMIEMSGQDIILHVDSSRLRGGDARIIYGSVKALNDLGLTPKSPDFEVLLLQLLSAAE